MPVSPARTITFDVLSRVEAEGAYASDLLHAELGARITPADAALATELTMGVLRWRRLLDFLLERQLKKPIGRLDLPVAIALRMGIYQLRYLDKIPARAAVNESVELVKRARKTSAASLVNAVMRKMAAEAKSPARNFLPTGATLAERLGILHSHPTWMVERWLTHLGEPRTVALMETNNRAPQLSCSLQGTVRREEILGGLEKAGMHIEPGQLLKSAFGVTGGSPTRTDAFRTGQISIQDEASQAIPLLLGVRSGDRVLDLCAAPGGKTTVLVRAAGGEGLVVAADRHAHRLKSAQLQFARLGLGGVHLVELDAAQPLPFGGAFDRILVDAPCSGTGTLARHPEIRWRLQPNDLAESHRLQSLMFQTAIAQLAPGGRLVYSTCSIEPEENEDVVSEAIREALRNDKPIRLVPGAEAATALAPHLAPKISAAELFDASGHFRTSPEVQHTDGFFAAVIERQ